MCSALQHVLAGKPGKGFGGSQPTEAFDFPPVALQFGDLLDHYTDHAVSRSVKMFASPIINNTCLHASVAEHDVGRLDQQQ